MQKDRFARRKRKLTDKAEAIDDLGVATAGVFKNPRSFWLL